MTEAQTPTHITNKLSIQVNPQDELELYLDKYGILTKETLTPQQVRNLFVVYIKQASEEAGHWLLFGESEQQ